MEKEWLDNDSMYPKMKCMDDCVSISIAYYRTHRSLTMRSTIWIHIKEEYIMKYLIIPSYGKNLVWLDSWILLECSFEAGKNLEFFLVFGMIGSKYPSSKPVVKQVLLFCECCWNRLFSSKQERYYTVPSRRIKKHVSSTIPFETKKNVSSTVHSKETQS